MRLANVRKPKYLFLENVQGLLSHDSGRTFATILCAMEDCGYNAEWQVCNTKYTGIPQNRERVFIIGFLRGNSRPKILPIRGTTSKAIELQKQFVNTITTRTVGAKSTGSYVVEGKQLPQEPKLKQILGGKDANRVYDATGIARTLKANSGGGGAKTGLYAVPVLTPQRANKRQNGRRFKENGDEMFTLTTQDRHGIFDGKRIRVLTQKECFRLQGFPDEYYERAAAVNSESQLYKQAGNSVTVNIIYEFGKKFKEIENAESGSIHTTKKKGEITDE